MVLRIVIAALMLVGVMACGLASTIESGRLVDQVNQTLPADRRFNPIGWHLVKHIDFREAYERLGRGRYPPPRLLRLWIGMALFLAGAFLALVPFLAR
jgi:hypothetical protein